MSGIYARYLYRELGGDSQDPTWIFTTHGVGRRARGPEEIRLGSDTHEEARPRPSGIGLKEFAELRARGSAAARIRP